MASSEESEFESESRSGSRSPSLLETAGRKPSSSGNSSSKSGPKDGTSTVQPVVTPPATSQPSIERASEDEEESSSESQSEHEPKDFAPKKGRHAAAPSKLAEEELDWASVSLLLQLNGLGIDEEVLRVGVRMTDRSKVEEMKERLREFRMAELQLSVERVALTNDLAKLFMDGYRAARK